MQRITIGDYIRSLVPYEWMNTIPIERTPSLWKRLVSACGSALSGLHAIERSPSSLALHIRSLPKKYFETSPGGKSIEKIIDLLCSQGLLKQSKAEVLKDIEQSIVRESLDSGETTLKLLEMNGRKGVPTKDFSCYLACLEKIKRVLFRANKEVSFELELERTKLTCRLKEVKKEVGERFDRLAFDLLLTQEQIGQITQEITNAPLPLLESKSKILLSQEKKKQLQTICSLSLEGINKLETIEFQKNTLSLHLYKKFARDEISLLLAEVGSPSETISFRCIIVGPDESYKTSLAGVFGAQNLLYIPHIGTLRYQSKATCVHDLKSILEHKTADDHYIETTVWIEQQPCLWGALPLPQVSFQEPSIPSAPPPPPPAIAHTPSPMLVSL